MRPDPALSRKPRPRAPKPLPIEAEPNGFFVRGYGVQLLAAAISRDRQPIPTICRARIRGDGGFEGAPRGLPSMRFAKLDSARQVFLRSTDRWSVEAMQASLHAGALPGNRLDPRTSCPSYPSMG